MSPFDTKTIDEVTAILIDYRGKTPPKTEFGTKLITAKVIKDGFIVDGNHEYIADETYDSWMRRGLPIQRDILITTEAPLGEVAQLRTSERVALAQRVILLRGDPKVIDQDYYFQALKSPFVQAELRARSTGTTVLGIKQSELRYVRIPYYPLPTQQKIAGILCAYDDLIANNTRRLKILKEFAQLLYREWFVYFRFPGHTNVQIVDIGSGGAPRGWKVVQLGDLTSIYRGRSYRAPNLVDEGGLPFLNLKCIERGGGFRYDGVKHYQGDYKSTQIAKTGDVIIGVTDMTQERRIVAHAARVPNLNSPFAVLSMDLVKIDPIPEIAKDYLYGLLRYSGFSQQVSQHANGVNVLHLNPSQIQTFQFILPPKELRDKYAEFAGNIWEECDLLQLKNVNLSRTRDLLLPKLISGELDVSELNISLENVE